MSGGRRQGPPTVTARVLAILDSFSAGPSALTLAEITRRSGLAGSTAHRLVAELRAHGALERDDDLRYRIGPRLRSLAEMAPGGDGTPTRPREGHWTETNGDGIRLRERLLH